MSSITKTFFVRELVRLRRHIATLERSLATQDDQDSRYDGQRKQLEDAYHTRELLFELTEYAHDPAALLMECRMRYMRVQKQHQRVRAQMNGHGPTGGWWESLGEMQYYAYLVNRLQELIREYTPEEVEQELRSHTRALDLASTSAQLGLLRAMARAEGTYNENAHLVRDFVEAGGNGNGKPFR